MTVRHLIAAFVFAAGCADVDTGPNVPASLEFESLPFPAVVAGDTLRDTSGVAAPLRAIAFNSDNEAIIAPQLYYAALDGFVTVDSATGVVVGVVADSIARVIASAGSSLQSPPMRLSVVRRPDAVSRSGPIDTLRYSLTDTTANVSGDLAVRVAHRGSSGDVPVRDWIVTFSLQTPADSTRARIVAENGRASSADTTSASGVAARRVRLFPAGLTSAKDSIVVLARARYRGAHLSGSPVRLVLPVQPRVQ